MCIGRYVYNPLNKVARRMKTYMGKAQFRTAFLMILIPLAFVLLIEATHQNDSGFRTLLFICAGIIFLLVIWLWDITWRQVNEEDNAKRIKERQREDKDKAILDALLKLNNEIDERNKPTKERRVDKR